MPRLPTRTDRTGVATLCKRLLHADPRVRSLALVDLALRLHRGRQPGAAAGRWPAALLPAVVRTALGDTDHAVATRALRLLLDHDLLDIAVARRADLAQAYREAGLGPVPPDVAERRRALRTLLDAADLHAARARAACLPRVHCGDMIDPARHLLALAGVPAEHIRGLLRAAQRLRSPGPEHAPRPPLAGRVVATAFFEDSTRTKASFTEAAASLGARVIDCSGPGTSTAKGESLADTARTLRAVGAQALAVRCKQAGGPALIAAELDGTAGAVPCSVINAGDGRHEHPTQGLLDALTIAEHLGRADSLDLQGLRVAVVGDLVNSRVFRSDVAVLTALGARVVAVGPPTLAPPGLSALGCEVRHDLDAALEGVDAVQVLRVQFERHNQPGGTGALASVRDYRAGFALTRERARRLGPRVALLHPGPMNRGIEIDDEAARGGPGLPAPLMEAQVSLGVAVRRAVLLHVMGLSAVSAAAGVAGGSTGSARPAVAMAAAAGGPA